MQYIKGMQFYQNDKKTAITLGKFDGIHRGHETLIERVIAHQKNDGVDSVVFAFDMAPLYEKLKKKKESYGYACLTKEKRYYMENHPGVAVENGSLDEVIVMMIQGETV